MDLQMMFSFPLKYQSCSCRWCWALHRWVALCDSDINTSLCHLVLSHFHSPPDNIYPPRLTTQPFLFSLRPQTRRGPICPPSPWSWWTSSTLPRSRGLLPRRASNCSPSQQPRVQRNLPTRCVCGHVAEIIIACCGKSTSFPRCSVCLFAYLWNDCLPVLCFVLLYSIVSVCVQVLPAGSHSFPVAVAAGCATAGV